MRPALRFSAEREKIYCRGKWAEPNNVSPATTRAEYITHNKIISNRIWTGVRVHAEEIERHPKCMLNVTHIWAHRGIL